MDIIGNDVIGQPGQNLKTSELQLLVGIADGQPPSSIRDTMNMTHTDMILAESSIRAKLGAASKPHMITRGFILGVLVPRALCCLLVITSALTPDNPANRIRTRSPSSRISRSVRTAQHA